ncbi:MAG: acetate--CoA ligase family protein [Spirochaetes bacterium]|nr:acetate--CoA ligase family protein [Spirochaetota bacterium]
MNPRSIAIAGASNNAMKMGTMHALSILKDGYGGTLYPIHPKEETVLGCRAYRNPGELPEVPDLAFLVVPAPQVLALMKDFGEIGTKSAVIISAGFRETGDDGKNLEESLREISEKYGIRFVGPNCMGIINTEISLNTTVVPLTARPGLLGIASQSGTYITQSIPYLGRRGIRFSKAISVGNEANLGIIDALEYLGMDEQTRAVALYIEGIRDIPGFLDVARRITPRKPVVAQYVGGSDAGARSGLSHTGALAGPDHIYEGMFKQAGIIRVHSVEDLYGQGWALATQPPLRGTRIGVITNSGGPGTAISNVLDNHGLRVPPFSEKLRESLKAHIPPHAPAGNPVDITFSMEIKTLTRTLTELIMKSGEVDGIVMHGVMMSGYIREAYDHIKELLGNIPLEDLLKALTKDISEDIELPYKYGIPLLLSSFFGREDNYTEQYEDANVPVFDSPEKTARAMTVLNRYRLIRERSAGTFSTVEKKHPEAERILAAAVSHSPAALDEHSAKMLLGSYGIPVTEEVLAGSEQEVLEAAERLGYPAVMKACAADIPHKTERGLVHLSLKDRDEVAVAYRKIQENAPGVPVICYRMVRGSREIMAGMTRHKGVGPCVLFGLGGIYAEAMKDAAFRVAPLSDTDAAEMLDDIRGSAILGGFRGMPPVNRMTLASILRTLGDIAILHPEITEIDINPILIQGESPVVVDALIVTDGGGR